MIKNFGFNFQFMKRHSKLKLAGAVLSDWNFYSSTHSTYQLEYLFLYWQCFLGIYISEHSYLKNKISISQQSWHMTYLKGKWNHYSKGNLACYQNKYSYILLQTSLEIPEHGPGSVCALSMWPKCLETVSYFRTWYCIILNMLK